MKKRVARLSPKTSGKPRKAVAPPKTTRPRATATTRRTRARAAPAAVPRTRLELDPDDMQRSLMRLLLSLAGFVRDLLERQTLRRLERGTLSPAEVERLGRALMQLEGTIGDLARQFDLDPEELNLGLGPLGRLR
jgi:hypothetical protein